MNGQKGIVKDFLKKYRMDYEDISIEQGCRNFMEDMADGLEGRESTLRMIPTYLTMDREIPLEEPVIVIDAGGTNFRVASLYFSRERKAVIQDYKVYPMPGSKGEISRDGFFEAVVTYLKPVINKSSKIGFCFSYAMETLPNKDGRVLQFSKEVQVKDMIGRLIGENLLESLKASGCAADKDIVLLNDTVATLLGGKASYPDRLFDSYIGFILGTGTNTCYIEDNANIKKVPDIAGRQGSMLINTESGGFGRIEMSIIDREFQNSTVDPGESIFEKMISGRYQGELLLAVVKKAAEDGLFSHYFTQNIANIDTLSTQEMNNFLNYPYSGSLLSGCCLKGCDDNVILYYLIDAVVERAARLAAINLASIMMKTGRGKNPCKPVCITAEGSTFYKSKLLRNKIEYYMKEYVNDKIGYYSEFVSADNATLIGTAIAALLN